MTRDDFKVLELFAGIGACSKALTNLGIEHTIVDAVEIDKFAIASFNAVHGTNFEPQDITKWDKDIECDLIMHGSPCQDFSIAGKQAGGDKDAGTRSSLMYETLRIVQKTLPKYVIWENVKNLLSKKHRHNFDAYQKAMEDMGYINHYQVLNAKDYGVPQNRERVFTVSIRGDLYDREFVFPSPIPLEKKLKDVLEESVDEKFYLDGDRIKNYLRDFGSKGKELDVNNCAPTMTAAMGSGGGNIPIVKANRLGGIYDKDDRKHQAGSIYDKNGLCGTLSTMQGGNQEPIILDDLYKNREPREYNETSPALRSGRQGLKVVASRGREYNSTEEPFIVASRGRADGEWYSNEHYQKLEPRTDNLTNTISVVQKDNYVAIRTANTKGYDLAKDGDGIDLAYPKSNTRRGRVGHGVAKTIPTSGNQGTLDGMRIRKLTPKECWRLMGFDDQSFERAAKVNSNTQLYKQAGNSIVVSVLEAVLSNLLDPTLSSCE